MTARLQSRTAAVALVLALDLLVLAAGWFLVVAPQRHAATSAADQVQATEAQIQQTRNAVTTSAAATQPVIRTADLYRLAKAMPSTTDMPDLLLELSQVARASGATLLSVTPSAPTAGSGGYQVVPIGLSLSGDFYSVTDALYRLRQLVSVRHGALDASGRLFSVSSVALAPSGTTGKTLTATVSVEAYVYGAVPTGTAGAPVPSATTSTSTSTTGTTTTTTSGGH